VRCTHIGVVALGLTASMPAAAQSIDLSATVEGAAGYAVNPQLRPGERGGAGFGRVSISPVLSRATALSQTVLSGSYRREQYFSSFGRTQSITASLGHNQAFTEHLRGNIGVNYTQADNLLLNPDIDLSQVNSLTDGRKTKSLSAQAGLSWTIGADDSVNLSGQYAHSRSGTGLLANSYNQYSGDVSYLHAISAWTRIGVRSSYSYFDNSAFSSTSIGPGVVIDHSFTPIWKLNGDVGIIIQRSGAPVNSTSTSLGFHLSLCGTYPRTTMCLLAGRQTSASAFGGQQVQTNVGASYSYKLTELSSISASANYGRNGGGAPNSGSSQVFRASANYNRTLTERISIGVEATGGYYKNGVTGNARSIEGSAYARVKIG